MVVVTTWNKYMIHKDEWYMGATIAIVDNFFTINKHYYVKIINFLYRYE